VVSLSGEFFKKYFQKKYFENNKILQKSIFKIPNKILSIEYFENTK